MIQLIISVLNFLCSKILLTLIVSFTFFPRNISWNYCCKSVSNPHSQIGMIAWRLTLHTPEYPSGRDIIVIANDITYLIGSFGPREDIVFCLASELARKLKIPRIYIAANSGARIGLAEEIKQLFRVAWEDPEEPDKVIYFSWVCEISFNVVLAWDSHSEYCEEVCLLGYNAT